MNDDGGLALSSVSSALRKPAIEISGFDALALDVQVCEDAVRNDVRAVGAPLKLLPPASLDAKLFEVVCKFAFSCGALSAAVDFLLGHFLYRLVTAPSMATGML